MSSSTTIYINQERPNIAQTVKSALFNYYDTMLPLEEMADEDGFYIDVLESGLVVNQRQEKQVEQIGQYDFPIKLGQLLQAIQMHQHNQMLDHNAQPIVMGNYILYPETNILKITHEKLVNDIRLTDKEYEIIKKLYEISPKRISRDNLLHQIWGYGENIETHTLETHIYRLRQKVEHDPSEPDFLKTDDDGYFLNF